MKIGTDTDICLHLTREEAILLFRLVGHHLVGTSRTAGVYGQLKTVLGVTDKDCEALPVVHVTTGDVPRLAMRHDL